MGPRRLVVIDVDDEDGTHSAVPLSFRGLGTDPGKAAAADDALRRFHEAKASAAVLRGARASSGKDTDGDLDPGVPAAARSKRARARPEKDEADGMGEEEEEDEEDGQEPPLGVAPEDAPSFRAVEAEELRAKLLRWYDAGHRSLPWRERAKAAEAARLGARPSLDDAEADAIGYAVWVSEVMLQQTRVDTVMGYYDAWMRRWPTAAALAAASREDVHAAWAGLGYYRRAQFLHEGAQMVVADHGGRLPRSAAGLKRIRGIGEYTAGAVASIAFGEAAPIVDGNVVRVLARLRRIGADPGSTPAMRAFWRLSGELVDPVRPGSFNQALMELGATLCTTARPACERCPLQAACGAYAEGPEAVLRYPGRKRKAEKRDETVFVSVLLAAADRAAAAAGGAPMLLCQRPDSGLLASLWEFPSVVVDADDVHASGVLARHRRAVDKLLQSRVGLAGGASEAGGARRVYVGECVHLFSHIRQTLRVELQLVGRDVATRPMPDGARAVWLAAGQLDTVGVSRGTRKCLEMVQKYLATSGGLLRMGGK